jgi:hypothetical protein
MLAQLQEIIADIGAPLQVHPTSTIVMVVTVGCFALQAAAYAWLSSLDPPATANDPRLVERRADGSTRIVGLAFAVFASLSAMWVLWTCDGQLSTELYQMDERAQFTFAVAVGFFLWDIYVCVAYNWGWMFIVHGVLGCFVYLAGLRPFLHHIGMVSLLYETSTIFMHLRRFAIAYDWNRMVPGVIDQLSWAFAFAFFVARILIGLTSSVLWWIQMYDYVLVGRAHSVLVYSLYVASNLVFCGLNINWFRQIVQTACRSRGSKTALSEANEKEA